MKLIPALTDLIQKLDSLSPYPLFYHWKMSRPERTLFDRSIAQSKHYLEFGMGGSTLRALQKSKAKIYSVESSPDWISHMRKFTLIKLREKKRLHIVAVDIGPTRKWGFPASEEYHDRFPAYSSDVFNLIDSQLIDLTLVDGRFRVACVLKIILECHGNQNLKILIHDLYVREEYSVVFKYLEVVEIAETLGLFTIIADVDLKAVGVDYDVYKFDAF